MPAPQQITVNDVTLTLSVERKRVKNVNARLRGSTLYISAPPGISSERLEAIAEDLARKLLRREHARRRATRTGGSAERRMPV